MKKSESEIVRVDTEKQPPPGVNVEQLLGTLKHLGFSDHEARAYVAFFGEGPATAYQISQKTGLPRANIYNAVGALLARGAVQQVSVDPLRYVPRPPSEFFSSVAANIASHCDLATEEVAKLANAETWNYVAHYEGAERVAAKIKEIMTEARERIYIKTAAPLLEPFHEDILKAAERGVKLFIVAVNPGLDDLPRHDNIEIIPHEGKGAVTGRALNYLVTISIDAKETFIASYGRGSMGYYTHNKAIVYLLNTMILHEIYLAEIYRKLGPDIDELFGPDLEKLRGRYRPARMETGVLGLGDEE